MSRIFCISYLLCVLVPMQLLGQAKGVFSILESNVTSFRSVNSGSQMVRTGDSEVILGWRSARKGVPYNNIYIQKIDLAGKMYWELDGTPLCPYPSNQTDFSMVEDGYGGVIVVWEDYRNGADRPVVYAQRVNLRGEILWGLEGLRICDGFYGQRKPKIISDLEDGFYVVWEDYRNGMNEPDLYGQFLDLGGRLRWRVQGMPIATAPGIQQNFTITTDEKHFLYLMWEDFRNGLYWNLYAQKIDQTGNFFWKAGGLDVFAGVEENHQNPAMVADGYGGLLFVYQKYSNETHGTDIYRGRLSSGGEVVFHFATCYAPNEQLNPRIIKKGSKAILCWEDRRMGNWDIYAQMIRLQDGILEWDVNGAVVANGPLDERQPVVIGAASYGYQVVSWSRFSESGTHVLVQKLNNLGETAWENGVEICPQTQIQLEPIILPDEAGGLWCMWTDKQEMGAHVFVQHLNGNGLPLLQRSGLRLAGEHQSIYAKAAAVTMLAARSGEFFVVWEDYRNGARNPDIYIQKLDAQGKALWRRGGIPVCLAPGEQNRPLLVEDGVGGIIVTWFDRRNGIDDNIYSQRINSWGKLLWNQEGVEVCAAKGDQNSIRGVSDGNEGIVLCWVDTRTLTETGFDLYIQRVSHEGEMLWGRNGKPFSNFNGLQTSPSMVSDGMGGAYMAWMDARNDFPSVYVQHINSFGIYEWDFGGRPIATTGGAQRYPAISKNEHNELNLVWQESRYGEGYDKLFLQALTSNGGKMWASIGVPVCQYPGKQSAAQIIQGEGGDFWVAWLDERAKSQLGVQLIVQKFNLSGQSMWEPDGIKVGESMDEWNDFGGYANPNGHLFLIWSQNSTTSNKTVFYQKLDPDGLRKFDFSGAPLGGEDEHQTSPCIAGNLDGRVLIGWVQESLRSGQVGVYVMMMWEK